MSVEVAEDESISIRMVKNGGEIQLIIIGARRRRRNVDVINTNICVTEEDLDADDLQALVVKRRSVNWCIFDVVMDEDDEAATAAIARAVTAEEGVVVEELATTEHQPLEELTMPVS